MPPRDDDAEQTVIALARHALERGGAALATRDASSALRWLDRAHRLLPRDPVAAMMLGSACLDGDPARAAALFAAVTRHDDTRQAWFGLAAAGHRLGDRRAAAEALATMLSRHACLADSDELAGRIAGPRGWCGLRPDGALALHPAGPGALRIALDGRPLRRKSLPAGWESGRCLTVQRNGIDLLGSPIRIDAIRRTDGCVEPHEDGIRGWAWHPGDPETPPTLTLTDSGTGEQRTFVANEPADTVARFSPLARPRLIHLTCQELPPGPGPIHIRGPDGRDLPGSPLDPSAEPMPSMAVTPGPAPIRGLLAADPLVEPRRRFDRLVWRRAAPAFHRAAILITHNDGGGVEQRVAQAAQAHAQAGRRPIILRPADCGVAVHDGLSDDLPRLIFSLPQERPALLRLLRAAGADRIEAHHLADHPPAIYDLIAALGLPYEVHVHDYACLCPRIALVADRNRYCGEPEMAGCEACIARNGSLLPENIGIAPLRRRSAAFLTRAHRVVVPTDDVAIRLRRYFPNLSPTTVPHQDDTAPRPAPPSPRPVVCVTGSIGVHKGYEVLLDCARDAQRRALDLEFIVVGHTIDDASLMDTGRVFVTGRFDASEAVSLIAAQHAGFGFVPSICPETWCLGLTDLWRAGLDAAAFDIGAPAERIRRAGRGIILPLGLPPNAINNALLAAIQARHRAVLTY